MAMKAGKNLDSDAYIEDDLKYLERQLRSRVDMLAKYFNNDADPDDRAEREMSYLNALFSTKMAIDGMFAKMYENYVKEAMKD